MGSIKEFLVENGFFKLSRVLVKEEVSQNNSAEYTYRFVDKFYGIFQSFKFQVFFGEEISSIELQADCPVSIKSKDELLLSLFGIYGCDSNGVCQDSYPYHDPFGGELYCWYLNASGQVVSEEQDDLHHGVIWAQDVNDVVLSVLESQNLFNSDELKSLRPTST